ncbi:MAG: S1 RNA-binding domain-containing protein, partial [Pseudomonadota bacterium]
VTIEEIAEHISTTERASMVAERSAVDRFTAAYLSDQIGAEFSGKISGVTRFGLFVTLNESGADGLVPMKSIGNDFYIHDEDQHALIGRRHGRVFRLGAPVQVRLKEADGITGSTVLELAGESLEGADVPGMVFKPRKQRSERGRPSKSGAKSGHKRGRGKPHKGGGKGRSRGKSGKNTRKGKR